MSDHLYRAIVATGLCTALLCGVIVLAGILRRWIERSPLPAPAPETRRGVYDGWKT